MLTDKQCKNASCPEGKARIRASDSGGLYIEVAGAGSKRWFWKYYFDGKEKRLSLGSYPEVSLKDARAARDDARKQHQSGADPVLARQLDRLSSRFDANASFEVTAREFHTTKKVGWSDHYAKRWLERLGKDIFPWLGKLPLLQIGAPMLRQTLRRVEARAREPPHLLLEACSQVFRFGVSTGRCERNPAADLRGTAENRPPDGTYELSIGPDIRRSQGRAAEEHVPGADPERHPAVAAAGNGAAIPAGLAVQGQQPQGNRGRITRGSALPRPRCRSPRMAW